MAFGGLRYAKRAPGTTRGRAEAITGRRSGPGPRPGETTDLAGSSRQPGELRLEVPLAHVRPRQRQVVQAVPYLDDLDRGPEVPRRPAHVRHVEHGVAGPEAVVPGLAVDRLVGVQQQDGAGDRQ